VEFANQAFIRVTKSKRESIMKTCIRPLLIVLALIAGARHLQGQVTNLGIVPAGNQSVLFWPASATNSVLQSTTNLGLPNWVTVSNAIPVTAVAVSNTSPAMFFRLFNTNPPGMALIAAGPFTMGDALDGESDAMPTLSITVSAFYMDTNLVSYSQWQSVYNWATNAGYGFDHAGSGKAANHPVQSVGWYDAVKWCNARSQQAGLIPVYYTDTGLTQVYTNGDVAITNVNWSANGYRLPTEAEWEKAARGGLTGQRFPLGDIISETNANYSGDTTDYSYDLGPDGNNAVGTSSGYPYTTPVGYFAPNGYGLYDMAGNVSDWCWDWYGTPYGQPTTTNPTGPATGSLRVVRGGNWGALAYALSCAARGGANQNTGANYIGFRCVKGL
jgi:formylglycine-generating enzyme required for sulfatase activity